MHDNINSSNNYSNATTNNKKVNTLNKAMHRLRAIKGKDIECKMTILSFFYSFSTPTHQANSNSSKSKPAKEASIFSMEQPKQETHLQINVENGDSNVGSGSKSEDPTGSMKKSVHWSPQLVTESTFVSSPPSLSFNALKTVVSLIGRWGRKAGEATRKAETLAGNTWQHLKTSPSFSEAAMGRIAQGTKVLAEGGYEKIFLHTFETVPEERLQNSYACYLSTSTGPVMGVLYISTAKIAYSSDSPISYKSDNKTEWSYYKVTIPLHELKVVNPSSSNTNPAEKYIQVITIDNHEFWFMGFLNYEGAVDSLQEALQAGKSLQSVA